MMIKFLRNRKAQSTLEYVLVATAVITAIILASLWIKARVGDSQNPYDESLLGRAGTVIGCAADDLTYRP